MKVGFIGTGHMGAPMVRNLLRHGHEVVVNDAVRDHADSSVAEGAIWADTPKAVAEQCRVVLASLPGPPEVDEAVLGADGILAGAKAGDVFFDLSTNSPTSIKRVAALAARKGVIVLDAPVSGGVDGAIRGSLSIMVGGNRAAFEANRAVLECIGKSLFHLGEVGNGNVAKLSNQLIIMSLNAVASEAMVLGVKAGIPAETLRDVIMASSGRCTPIENMDQTVLAGNFEPGFMVDLGAKDLWLAVGLGKDVGCPTPMAAAALQRFVEAHAKGLGRMGTPAIILPLEETVGVQVRAAEIRNP